MHARFESAKHFLGKLGALALMMVGLEAAAVPTTVDVSIPVNGWNAASKYTETMTINGSHARAGRFLGTVKGHGTDGNVFLGPNSSRFGARDFWAWCIDADEYVSAHMNGMKVEAITNGNLLKAASLFDYRTGDFSAHSGLSIHNQHHVTAFQLLLWNLVGDIGSVNMGTVRQGAKDTYMALLGKLDSLSASGNVRIWALRGHGHQDQMVATLVPIPGAVWLFGSALLVLAGLNSRKPRRATAAA